MVIRDFGCMNGLCLGLKHIHGVVRTILVVNGRLGGIGKLGTIANLVVIIVNDEAQQIMDTLLHIVLEIKEDQCELLTKLREVIVGWLPQNGVKYVESCCKE